MIVALAVAVAWAVPSVAPAAAAAKPAAKANSRRVVACSARRYRHHPRARRACQARMRAMRLRHKPHKPTPPRHPSTPTHQVSAQASSPSPSASTQASTPASTPPPVASTAPCANTDVMPDPTNLPQVNAAALCLVNQLRGQHGLPALVENSQLQGAAQRHTDDMVAQSYFAHTGPAGDDPLSRITDSGYLSDNSMGYIVGENIAWGTLTLATPSSIVQAWINSPEHLANMLNPAYRDTGMAASGQAPPTMALGQAGAVYTQDFGGRSN